VTFASHHHSASVQSDGVHGILPNGSELACRQERQSAQNFEKVNSKSGAFKKIGLLARELKRQGHRFFYQRAFFSTVTHCRGPVTSQKISQSSAETEKSDVVPCFYPETGILPPGRDSSNSGEKRTKEKHVASENHY
jgi:hypothetical protein